jgi:small GTP-binding protein
MKHGFWKTVNDVINHSDIVIHVLDARYPAESRNKEIEKMVRQKGRRLVYALNKFDLVDKNDDYPKDVHPLVKVSSKTGHGFTRLKLLLKKLRPNKSEKPKVGVVGYPNVGKSSVINRLRGYGILRTSSQPGFTKGKQYVSTPHFMLIDTPGVIPQEEKDDAKHLKMVSTSMDMKDPEVAVWDLMELYPGLIENHFKVEQQDDKEAVLEEIARKKNWITKGNKPDTIRTAKAILQLWQDAKITPRKY